MPAIISLPQTPSPRRRYAPPPYVDTLGGTLLVGRALGSGRLQFQSACHHEPHDTVPPAPACSVFV
ncbi:MAG: hypothetical protein OEM62_04940 [Acidobacteriota bacterium]|nr:hypothetical protein [Acidobacteriota bacterium]